MKENNTNTTQKRSNLFLENNGDNLKILGM
jgi:hypothetical protein